MYYTKGHRDIDECKLKHNPFYYILPIIRNSDRYRMRELHEHLTSEYELQGDFLYYLP